MGGRGHGKDRDIDNREGRGGGGGGGDAAGRQAGGDKTCYKYGRNRSCNYEQLMGLKWRVYGVPGATCAGGEEKRPTETGGGSRETGGHKDANGWP